MKTNYTTQPEKAYEKPGEWGTIQYTSISYEMPALNAFVEESEKDYSNEYLTTVALEDGTISFNIWKSMGTDMITSISYSTDNGETWNTTNNTDDKEEHLTITVDVSEGDEVLWKGDAQQTGYFDEDEGDSVGSFFSSTCEFDAKGNVMSLLYGDDFNGEITLENDYEFANLFADFYEENECLVVNAKDLSLPATTLADYCYYYMLWNCSSLTTAPKLPATKLAESCYYGMFYMCKKLTVAPELPATTLAINCYNQMFGDCTNLTTAPELPATTLVDSCYISMFYNCTSLNSITCLATNISADGCTSSWVGNVAANGTFTKASGMEDWTSGNSGIPTGWTVQNEMKEESIEAPTSYSVSEVKVGATNNVEKGTYLGSVGMDTAIDVTGVGLTADIVKLFNLTLGTELTPIGAGDDGVLFETADDNGIYQLTIGGEMWCQFFMDV